MRVVAALHPFYINRLRVLVDHTEIVAEWQTDVLKEGELQDIPGLEGITGEYIRFEGLMDPGEYLGILEVSPSTYRSRSLA